MALGYRRFAAVLFLAIEESGKGECDLSGVSGGNVPINPRSLAAAGAGSGNARVALPMGP
eukprot:5741861-Pyramimonas_sp.AAC.1